MTANLIAPPRLQPATFNIPGVREHAVFMKEVEDAMQVRRRLLQSLEHASAVYWQLVEERSRVNNLIAAAAAAAGGDGNARIEALEQRLRR